ncbi:MAG: indolepyruvate oxidoreductase subunit beta family protein, partial [Kordiimonas sp.]
MSNVRPTTIAIHALGGQGGGVLADWIVETAESAGYSAQYTFIAGVAQRTGATVYYIEIFPNHVADKAQQQPVMALMPVAGDVDIVVASELMEAGRSVSRGFVTPDKTTLIASSHRIYAIDEKMAMSDGRKDSEPVLEAAEASAKHFVSFDMESLAKDNGTIISAVMFGALAGSGALPISREVFEDVIKHAGRAVKTNLAGFAAGFERAQSQAVDESCSQSKEFVDAVAPAVKPLLDKLSVHFPVEVHKVLREGLKRVVDFQDPRYGDLYLERMRKIASLDKNLVGVKQNWRLTSETAKYLALAMSFEDTIRVADLKTRDTRFERVRDEVKAQHDQIIETTEYLHPRIEEVCDLLPNGVGKFIMERKGLKKFLGRFFKKGRFVKTDKLWGF